MQKCDLYIGIFTILHKWNGEKNYIYYLTLHDLQLIHSHDIIHCDLHSGNIFQDDFIILILTI